MDNNKVKVLKLTEVAQVNPATGKAEPHILVQFSIGQHGPFQESFPKAGFDPMHLNQRLLDFSNKLNQVHGL